VNVSREIYGGHSAAPASHLRTRFVMDFIRKGTMWTSAVTLASYFAVGS